MGRRKVEWVDDEHFVVDGVHFTSGFGRGGTATDLAIWKPRDLVQNYIDLVERLRPARIVEVGVAEGGSTALLALLAEPERLLAVDIEPRRRPGLDDLVAQRGLGDVVGLCYGVDQADVAALSAAVDGHLGPAPLDVVFDDASHLLGPSRATFDALFPRLRPGGCYVVEDWAWENQGADRMADALDTRGPAAPTLPATELLVDRLSADDVAFLSNGERTELPTEGQYASVATGQALSNLALELVLARARGGDVVRSLHVDGHWLVAERGDAALETGRFHLAGTFTDHFGQVRGRRLAP